MGEAEWLALERDNLVAAHVVARYTSPLWLNRSSIGCRLRRTKAQAEKKQRQAERGGAESRITRFQPPPCFGCRHRAHLRTALLIAQLKQEMTMTSLQIVDVLD